MKYTETLSWILDDDTRRYSEEKVRQNIDFVHSLGLKCDSVGWSELDLANPKAETYLEKIDAFCKSNGFHARGWYTRKFAETESEWYRLGSSTMPGDAVSEYVDIPVEGNDTVRAPCIKAYLLTPPSPKAESDGVYVPEYVRNACVDMELSGIRFCWVKDTGRYEAEQYFHAYPQSNLPRYCGGRGLHYSVRHDVASEDPALWSRILSLGGMLSRVAAVFYELRISLPTCFFSADLPSGGFAGVYSPRTYSEAGGASLLVHADTAKALLARKVISPRDLTPIPLVDTCPDGYCEVRAYQQPMPTDAYISAMDKACEALKAKPRPRRAITEKQALSALRKAKKERKEDFAKAMPKATAEALADTACAPLAPYYAIANGGALSDEYEFLSHARAMEETKVFEAELAAEELLDAPPRGTVIAVCPDSDRILLLPDGRVIRFSHEVPEAIGEWPSLSQFVYDALMEEE